MTRSFVRALAPLLAALAAFGCYVGGQELGHAWLGTPTTDASAVMEDRPAVTGSPAALVDRFDCWTAAEGRPGAVEVPGHVVVTVGGATRYGAGRLTGLALEQELSGVDHGLAVHGFCR